MSNYLLKGQSDEVILRTLHEAVRHALTPNEQLEQKVSFIWGALQSEEDQVVQNITKEHIRITLNAKSA